MSTERVPLEKLVQGWLEADKSPETRAEIEQLWKDGQTAELEKRLRTRIEFGTAGLRGRMEAGWSRMNDLIIIQSSQGLCEYVLQTVSSATTRGIVIGHDHRHHSSHWAKLTASVFASRGFKTYLLDGLVHTPMVPFSVKHLKAACGVMITASHNPKDDNGYKVYWENAVQIIAPHDTGISASIKSNLEVKQEVWTAAESVAVYEHTDDLITAYFAYLQTLCTSRSTNGYCDVKFVNTSMHGVGHPFVERGFEVFGFKPFVAIERQRDPDPEFPTVKFPNPEEKGALDLALEAASKEGATYVLAQDPDADRFSAAQRRPDGTWITFTGDQLGTLFAAKVFEAYKASGRPIDQLAMVASTVSSKMVEAIAEHEGFKFVECLTGFKFIGNTALDLTREGYTVPFGYEEAIGFMVSEEIRDKDGVSATLYFAELVADLHKSGSDAYSYLQELYAKYGFFQTSNSYFVCSEPATIDRIFARLRNYDGKANEHPSYPKSIGELSVTSIRDLTVGYDSSNPPYKPTLPLSSGHMVQFRAADANAKITLTIRTSGTEPKIKYYLEGSSKDAASVAPVLAGVVRELADEWMQAGPNNLGRP
ncbi:hypothetical protein PENSPDRAFT_678913 [Peniophora sp. CONT]|nr:hypothetical protein PENSPDRAFT_678913 [Peniophora sp. CONT]